MQQQMRTWVEWKVWVMIAVRLLSEDEQGAAYEFYMHRAPSFGQVRLWWQSHNSPHISVQYI
jgi:hypothetical protein